MKIRREKLIGCLTAAFLVVSNASNASTVRFFVTGNAPGIAGDVIFSVLADPTVAGSAIITIPITDPRALDGIALLPGTVSEVVVGARDGPPSIAHFDVGAGTTLPDFVPATNAVAGAGAGGTRPSSVLPTATHVYYTENQFGFSGPPHRIMRVDRTTGVVELVFDGADTGAGGLENFE